MVSSYWDCSLFPIKKAEQGHADRVGQRANNNEMNENDLGNDLGDAWTGTHRHPLRHALHGQLVPGGVKIGRKTKVQHKKHR
jgi:hypothetical protein